MAVKKCCIKTCKSCSTRKEDSGVTYHKFPKDDALRKTWILVTHSNDSVSYNYVCSRHFYKSDFQVNKESKYVLKSEAVPAIFPWSISKYTEMENMADFGTITSQESTEKMSESHENEANMSGSSKESDENVDAIKKFIEDQTKEIEDQKLAANKVLAAVYEINDGDIKNTNNQKDESVMASNVMDMILSDSEKLTQKKDIKEIPQQNLNMDEKLSSSMSLSVGSRVEAKDFSEVWHIAEIVEVDYDDMEVLVQYDQNTKKHNEWINVSSPRLRPIGSIPAKPVSIQREIIPEPVPIKTDDNERKVEKADDKTVMSFDVGERCLARWRDNRRFIATVHNDLGNGTYEIIFDDGFHWKCSKSRLYKWKPIKCGTLTVDTSLNSPTSSTHSPIQSGGPSNSITHSPQPVFHTHLFDPARDYLGSKSERREMKRKLNIKEIFNIGQKRSKLRKIDRDKPKPIVEKKPRVGKKSSKAKVETVVKQEIDVDIVKQEIDVDMKRKIPDAVASIIGTIQKDVFQTSEVKLENITETEEKSKEDTAIDDNVEEKEPCITLNDTTDPDESALSEGVKSDSDPVLEEEDKLENFEKQDEIKHEEVIDKMKEVINKLEDGLKNDIVCSPKPEIKEETTVIKEEFNVEIKEEIKEIDDVKDKPEESDTKVNTDSEKINKLSKIKKGKKLRLLREKKVKKQVEKVKNELEEMKKQVDEMRKQMLMKTQELTKVHTEMPESFLLPGEWCCRWVNGQPVGTVSEIVCEVKLHSDGRPALPRRSVQVEDKRLPPGWTKHMVRRSLGHSAGKWDVVLVSPENRRFHTKTDMRIYLENNPDKSLQLYEYALTDFGVHLKLARRMGWISNTPGGVADGPTQPINALSITSPLIKKKKQLSLNKQRKLERKKKFMLHLKKAEPLQAYMINTEEEEVRASTSKETELTTEIPLDVPPLEDGYVYVGSLKVQIIDNLLRCPADGCFKNFRNNTLLQMHIKHYHRELREMLGSTPKVLDLAYARTMPTDAEIPRSVDSKVLKVKINRLPKREDQKSESRINPDVLDVEPSTPICNEPDSIIPKTQDSPKLRDALVNKPVKRPKVLLPVRRPEPEQCLPEDIESLDNIDDDESPIDVPTVEQLDFETAICTHTVTKPNGEKKRSLKKLKSFAVVSQRQSEEEEWFAGNSDYESRSSYPRSGTPDSKVLERQLTQYIPEMNARPKQRDNASYMYTETGERIKLVRMKREEIINCHCGFREEDGLMVQCELCLCWQHALCHNIHNESQVPEKYTCSICVNPRRGRRSMRFLHDQDRLYEGLLPGAKPCDSLRRSHELSGNLLLLRDALHALRVKSYVAMKKNHPKLYLWAQDWEQAEITSTQEKLNSGYSDLTIVPNNANKEFPPVSNQHVLRDLPLHINTTSSEEQDFARYAEREDSQGMLSDLISNPCDATLELPISTSELEQLANTVQAVEESALASISAPEPEPPIENSVCCEQLLSHIQHCQALIDARLDSIEAQVAELESQDPTVEGDDTADNFPRTKQTIKMLMRDLDALEELGIIT